MKCAWNAFLSILPLHLRSEVDKLGRDTLQELHLRVSRPIELILSGESILLNISATKEDIQYVVNTASRYSPWAASTVAQGYITAQGGHRIGIGGECVIKAGVVTGIRRGTSLCIRVARSFTGIGSRAPQKGSVLIIGPPGTGKTTLLRDMIRIRSINGCAVSVVDERGELFPDQTGFDVGPRTDIITGCSKAQGIDMALRTLGPKCIAMDEITAAEDCQAFLNAAWCGVDLLATVHARDRADLMRRPIYQPLAQSGLFKHAIVLNRDKSWYLERMDLCT